MILFSTPPISIVFFFSLLIFVFAVRSEDISSAIRLPSEATNNHGDIDLCSVSAPSYCPVKCFRTDPVCGVDGVTYWCGCADALCSGVKVAKMGFCEVGNGGSAPIPAQALLLVHILPIILGVSVLFGLF
ncbi:uncharacterized protein LOC101220346 [Cucumis sativus]|uniref:Kazal-like domain-containing protein n=1 Tax=Cucumis sativus TaxID=3659 RepID=A0A0A0L0T2_CUCSA|nr:uncharacterized protein LOC101220346 [Cucumis sativus]KGN53751.1 hypothetical protein Csa_014957 [Cucumis sativus]